MAAAAISARRSDAKSALQNDREATTTGRNSGSASGRCPRLKEHGRTAAEAAVGHPRRQKAERLREADRAPPAVARPHNRRGERDQAALQRFVVRRKQRKKAVAVVR
jgi:hypothetical protein